MKILNMVFMKKGMGILFFSLAIMLLYLGCECFSGIDGVSRYFCPALIHGLMILSLYLAWRSYTEERVPVAVSLLLSGIAVMLPFAEGWQGRFGWEWVEKVFEFVWILWPIPVICLSNYCVHKLSENKRFICMVALFFILLPVAVLHWFAKTTGGEKAGIDLCIPVIWIAEGILWIFVLNFTNQEKHGKRNLMAARIICLLLFGLFTYADISYLSPPAIWDSVRGKYWNKVIFFCSPILLLSVMKMLEIHITEEKPYFLQKRKLLYSIIVLLLIYFITDNGMNFAVKSLKYDIAGGFYLLFLADIIFWKEIDGKPGQTDRQPPEGRSTYSSRKCRSFSAFSCRR